MAPTRSVLRSFELNCRGTLRNYSNPEHLETTSQTVPLAHEVSQNVQMLNLQARRLFCVSLAESFSRKQLMIVPVTLLFFSQIVRVEWLVIKGCRRDQFCLFSRQIPLFFVENKVNDLKREKSAFVGVLA